ncbi:UNVERIFIED_CONTAM: hypothetical protein Sradi_7241000 [Sesamum radiatum]|uniref:AB hydrolase-1 domain-containing protein n=1 Tax=Sesamum radiatum TaxID=300843 RepID=A0AAW2ILR8_SESRA
MVVELGRGCRDVLQQTVLTEDSYIVKKTKGPLAEVSETLRFLNEFLPEDRDPGTYTGYQSVVAGRIWCRLISYDLPGFGESDPHPNRNLNSSALDMSHLADSVGVKGKFWVLGYSSGSLHAWASLKYIPDKVAGVAMLAPFVNPYEVSMTKEEMSRTWENWTRRRKLLYYLARRFPRFLSYFYSRTFLSGKHGQIDKWLALSLAKKDKDLVETSAFEELWHRDVEESVRQGNLKTLCRGSSTPSDKLVLASWIFKCRGNVPEKAFSLGSSSCMGLDDIVVPPSMTDYVARILPNAIVHRLPEEGHFSFFVSAMNAI